MWPTELNRPGMGPVLCGPTSIRHVLWCRYCLHSTWRAESNGEIIFVATSFLTNLPTFYKLWILNFVMQFIYLLARPDGSMQLSHFIVIFGIFTLILAQIPSFHSVRHINLVSLILCFAYCAYTTAGAIYIGTNNLFFCYWFSSFHIFYQMLILKSNNFQEIRIRGLERTTHWPGQE